MEHHRLLLNIAYFRAVKLHIYIADIHSVNKYLAVVIVIIPHKQVYKCRFSGARRSHYAYYVARFNNDINVA